MPGLWSRGGALPTDISSRPIRTREKEIRMIFRQLFEHGSSTYTYLLGCRHTSQAVLLDPVLETVERDLSVLRTLDLRLVCTVETHVHADHLSSAWILRDRTGCRVAYPATDGVPCADLHTAEDRPLCFSHLSSTAAAYAWAHCRPPQLPLPRQRAADAFHRRRASDRRMRPHRSSGRRCRHPLSFHS